jgi:hypothetical protein
MKAPESPKIEGLRRDERDLLPHHRLHERAPKRQGKSSSVRGELQTGHEDAHLARDSMKNPEAACLQFDGGR